mgnify:CR=1 FL=1
MTNRIVFVKPMDNTILLVRFQNGIEKTYDVKNMFKMFPQMQILEKDMALFNSVVVDTGGYGLSWNDELDIEAEEIWENGTEIGREAQSIFLKLGYDLSIARENVGLTQKELADRTGIDQANISKIERGIANPSLATLKRLACGVGTQLKIEFLPINK